MIFSKRWIYILICWGIFSTLLINWAIDKNIDVFEADFKTKAYSLHRLVSQRADQHDAHLTGLSTLASTNEAPLYEIMDSLVETISTFYSRITHVDLIRLDRENPKTLFTTRPNSLDISLRKSINSSATSSTGKLAILPIDNGYLLVKRSPNTPTAKYGLSLTIDGNKLLDSDLLTASDYMLELSTDDGTILFTKDNILSQHPLSKRLTLKLPLGSNSQPLILKIDKLIPARQAIPWTLITLYLLLSIVVIVGYKAYSKQQAHTKLAEDHAQLKEHEARIAHASRVNGLGEMASGIAHEITQPLTAILSQSQAGEHLVKRKAEDQEAIEQVFKNITLQTKRAGDILVRLRKWSSPSNNEAEKVDLNFVARGIESLMRADLDEKDIQLSLTLSKTPPIIRADAVQIEQVLFNLARNSVDAMGDKPKGRLEIITEIIENHAIIKVVDNGMGITKEILAQSNHPFFTTKENGLGLGLPLCESIVERFDGSLELQSDGTNGTMAIIKFKRDTDVNS